MTDRARQVLHDAMELCDEERADLAAELLATLPPDAAEELHPDWLPEIERRARRAPGAPPRRGAWWPKAR